MSIRALVQSAKCRINTEEDEYYYLQVTYKGRKLLLQLPEHQYYGLGSELEAFEFFNELQRQVNDNAKRKNNTT